MNWSEEEKSCLSTQGPSKKKNLSATSEASELSPQGPQYVFCMAKKVSPSPKDMLLEFSPRKPCCIQQFPLSRQQTLVTQETLATKHPVAMFTTLIRCHILQFGCQKRKYARIPHGSESENKSSIV